METEHGLRERLLLIREKGIRPSTIADRAGVSRACLSKFMNGRSRYLRSDIFTRICEIARADAQRLRL
jgi:DNA-binding Xre family transcriptional regulator